MLQILDSNFALSEGFSGFLVSQTLVLRTGEKLFVQVRCVSALFARQCWGMRSSPDLSSVRSGSRVGIALLLLVGSRVSLPLVPALPFYPPSCF